MTLAPDELARLAHKYETLAALRRARDAGEPVPEAHVFRALSHEFPGCLNELDTLPLEDVDRRAAELAAAANGGPVSPWMEWLSGYHRLLRAALFLKPRVARGANLDDALAAALAEKASLEAATPVDASFVHGVAAPPGGRLVALVLATLARAHGEAAPTIKRAIFPRTRRP